MAVGLQGRQWETRLTGAPLTRVQPSGLALSDQSPKSAARLASAPCFRWARRRAG